MRQVYLKPATAVQYRKKGPASVTAFGGYDHRPVIADGSWYDEQNLSVDQYPLLTIRKNRKKVEAKDVMVSSATLPWEAAGVLAFCAGDQLIVLDTNGVIYAGDHYMKLLSGTNWFSSSKHCAEATVTVSGYDYQNFVTGLLGSFYGTVKLEYKAADALWYVKELKGKPELVTPTTGYTTSQVGLTVTGNLADGDWVKFRYYKTLTTDKTVARSLVRMGAYVVVFPDKVFCNVVKLAAGSTMVSGTDYGPLEQVNRLDSTNNTGQDVYLKLCDGEGTVYSSLDVSATAPSGGLWLDISTGTPVLRQYSVALGTWEQILTVYVRVESTGIGTGLQAGDGVTISSVFGGQDEFDFLNGSQVLKAVGANYIVVTGILNLGPGASNSVHFTLSQDGGITRYIEVARTIPQMDFVVECGNRLWGCYCGTDAEGNHLNEIYASALGDFKNWHVFQGTSMDSYVASRGADGDFTGAAVLDGHPLFFRERMVEKVFPSSTGAHQIQAQTLEGVQQGSGRSVVVIDDRLYYKGLGGVYMYTGTLPTLISPQFGEISYSGATAGAHGKKYYIAMREALDSSAQAPQNDNTWRLFSFDTQSGIWHKEDAPWDEEEDPGVLVSWRSKLFWVEDWQLWAVDGGTDSRGVRWNAVSGVLGLDMPQQKYVSRLNLRYRLDLGASVRVYVMYDETGVWHCKEELHGTKLHAGVISIWPRRCDTFRIRLEGEGGFTLYSMSWERERGSDVRI